MTATEFLLITLDGVSPDIYDEYVAPYMDHSVPVAACGSSLPPATTPATHHLQTGYDGSHDSVYGYYARAEPDDRGPPSGLAEGAAPLARPTALEALDAAGVTGLQTWVPNSWPADAYTLASSWVFGGLQGSNHSDRQLSTNPGALAEQVGARHGATMQEPGMQYAVDAERAWTRARDRLDARVDATLWAADRLSPAFVWLYVFPTDQLNHWHLPSATHSLLDPDVGLYERAYEHIAGQVDRAIEALDPDALAICSDHGFRPYERKAFINTRLVEGGYLAPGDDADGAIDPARGHARVPFGIDRDESVAICRKDKVWVEDAHRDAVREWLESWTDPMYDAPVVGEVVEPEWSGPFADAGPDFVVRPNTDDPGWDFLYPGLDEGLTIADSVGAHSSEAICGGDVAAGSIHDVPHAVCEHFGVDLAEANEAVAVERPAVASVYGEAESEALEERLEGLGYR